MKSEACVTFPRPDYVFLRSFLIVVEFQMCAGVICYSCRTCLIGEEDSELLCLELLGGVDIPSAAVSNLTLAPATQDREHERSRSDNPGGVSPGGILHSTTRG